MKRRVGARGLADAALDVGIAAAEAGLVPDPALRAATRQFCRRRLDRASGEHRATPPGTWIERLSQGPIAPDPASANRQHYEIPGDFFQHVLGPQLKYSCCFWPHESITLAEAEAAALDKYCRRARLSDGMQILDLGCGWGSLSLWLAGRYPAARITAVSNSASQRAFIESRSAALGLTNVAAITADVNVFDPGRKFDRVMSIEMFEHMRNYRELLARIGSWLNPGGRLFVHLFAHRRFCYGFETGGAGDWIARYFFSGGLMPSSQLLRQFDRDMFVEKEWWWSGRHYQLTAEAWLRRMEANREPLLRVLAHTYGPGEAKRWYRRWRLFFVACAEQWGYAGGREWGVGHYLLAPRTSVPA